MISKSLQALLISCGFATVLGISLTSCDNPKTLRYKLTVKTDDNGRIVEGSTTREERWARWYSPLADGRTGVSWSVSGDALPLQVNGRWLVVTLKSWAKYRKSGVGDWRGCTGPYASGAGSLWCGVADDWLALPKLAAAQGIASENSDGRKLADSVASGETHTKATLGEVDLPVLVTFTGPPDLTTVKAVDSRNLSATLGPGVKFD